MLRDRSDILRTQTHADTLQAFYPLNLKETQKKMRGNDCSAAIKHNKKSPFFFYFFDINFLCLQKFKMTKN